MKTKVLSCFIIFAMLLSTFLLEFPAIAADTADTAAWDGSVAASFSGGSGTADDPWKISNGSELAYLASVVNSNGSATHNQYYILTADIDLGGQEWTGIGNQNDAGKAFKGKFDGNGKVITGFAIEEERDYTPGLFGMLDGGAVVKNLTVHGCIRAGSKNDFGGLLCVSVNGGSAVENCTVYADVQITRAAGSKNFYFGGITGRLAPGGKIQDCTVLGKIQLQVTASATNTQRQYTAGIAARIDAAEIINCKNYADISQIFTGSATIGYSGGIVALGQANEKTTASIRNCVNYGDIFVESNGGQGRTGGIFGNPKSVAVYTIENCFNAGKVLYGKGTDSGFMGELVGLNEAGKLNLINCYASGHNLAGNKGKGNLNASGCVTDITLKTLTGASVRLNDPTGLRFDTEIKKSTLDALLKADNVTVKIGTLIAPTKYVKAVGTFTADALDTYKNEQGFAFDPYINVPFDTNVYEFLKKTDTAYTFSGAVANLFESNYNLAYSAVGYLTITVGDLSVTFYSDYIEQDHSRTIASVAREAYNDRADAQSENYPYYVDKEGNYSPYSNSSLAKIKAFADAYKE